MASDPKPPTPPTDIPYARMAFHAVLAGVVFYSLNRFALSQPFETSLLWGVIAAPFAAYLAYSQARR